MLSPERLTVKAAEAIQSAAQEARRREHPQIEGVHLFQALLNQEDGIVVPILQKLGAPVSVLRGRTQEELEKRARVTGGSEPSISRDLTRAFDVAEDVARGLGDDYVSTEHLLLGLAEEKGDAGAILRQAGASRSDLEEALEGVRGSHRDMYHILRGHVIHH